MVLGPLKINYTQLMDLRIDYAFKLLFTKGDPRLLISLLNAIFANKKIGRVIKALTVKNPYLDKESMEDKLSILDIRAELEDGTVVLIEMHFHGLGEIKAKTIRSWARAYGEELEVGQSYTTQPPTISIAFTNGAVKPIANASALHHKKDNKENKENKDKIHRLCMIMDCEDNTIFTNAMELHYIDMQAFARAVNETDSVSIEDTDELMFAKWLSIITQKEINNKAIIEEACKEEEIHMAVSALARQSEDKIIRQAYARRQDEIYFYNKERAEAEQYRLQAEQYRLKAEQAEQYQLKAEQAEHKTTQAEAENEKLRKQIAALQAQIG